MGSEWAFIEVFRKKEQTITKRGWLNRKTEHQLYTKGKSGLRDIRRFCYHWFHDKGRSSGNFEIVLIQSCFTRFEWPSIYTFSFFIPFPMLRLLFSQSANESIFSLSIVFCFRVIGMPECWIIAIKLSWISYLCSWWMDLFHDLQSTDTYSFLRCCYTKHWTDTDDCQLDIHWCLIGER